MVTERLVYSNRKSDYSWWQKDYVILIAGRLFTLEERRFSSGRDDVVISLVMRQTVQYIVFKVLEMFYKLVKSDNYSD